jgi:hypothetical protein
MMFVCIGTKTNFFPMHTNPKSSRFKIKIIIFIHLQNQDTKNNSSEIGC